MSEKVEINVTVNGLVHTGMVEPRLLLSDFLRHALEMTGTHVGCEHGVCGACTVLLDGRSARSCLTLAIQADGLTLETIEGQGSRENLGRIQAAFRDHHALQCGYCTPGFIMASAGLLRRNPQPTEAEIIEALGSNICRCTGYVKIIEAVKYAAALHATGVAA